MRNKILAGIAAGAVTALGLMVAPAHAASAGDAQLSVLHGVPGTAVDVYVNGERTLDDFQPGTLAGPLALPAGDYEVALTATDAADDSSPIVGPVTLTLAADTDYTAVAHLPAAGGTPTVTAFTNDTSATAAGEGRLTVRHVAAAPAVDVLAGGSPVIEDLSNPNEATLDLPAGTVSASVAAAGTTDPVLGPTDVDVQEGALTIVYAWGSLEDDNLAVAVQTISGLHSAPDGVPSGSGGQLAAQDATVRALFVLGGLAAAALVAASALVVARARTDR
ncbi:DUF4397 domain-containing protein [Microbacterium hibisci]|uniref:DUF4397 domain-containing protein n=1 Tax=Microbacterium hibisci TaxID=2036000 RepID=UPI001943D551|nr:DUF4397 domain-containing protein [Microbacterium hibisci]